jgi:ankyrin repeat protein
MQGESQFEFIHFTFVEYFTADLLANWLKRTAEHHKNPQVQELLLESILLEPKHAVIRLFLNGLLGKSSLNEIRVITLTDDAKSLLDNSIENPLRDTVLHVAAREGHTKIIGFSLDSLKEYPNTLKALVVATNKDRQTALDLAAEYGHGGVVKQLLESEKAYPDTLKALVVATDGYRRTALHLAADHGHGEVVKQLLESVKAYPYTFKALVVATEGYDRTALHWAAEHGYGEVAKQLLESVKAYPDTLKALGGGH